MPPACRRSHPPPPGRPDPLAPPRPEQGRGGAEGAGEVSVVLGEEGAADGEDDAQLLGGGAEEVCRLHESDVLRRILEGAPGQDPAFVKSLVKLGSRGRG